MKKGFTLIELIAVIAILGVILAVSIPGTMGIIESNRNESFTLIAKAAVSAARVHASSNDVVWPNTTDSVMLLTFEDMELDYEAITKGVDIDSAKSYVLIDDEGNYYVTVVSSDGEIGIINLISSQLDEEVTQYLSLDKDGGLIPDDPKNNTTFTVDTNGDGSATDVELALFVYSSENPLDENLVAFGSNNPSDGETTDDLSTTFEIYYNKTNVKSVVLTINGINYYVHGDEAGTANDKILKTCKEIKSANPTASSGKYYIRPEASIIQVYCDMIANGGMMLLDNFKGSKGNMADIYGAAIGDSNIVETTTSCANNATPDMRAAGYIPSTVTLCDHTNYTIKQDYLQVFGTDNAFIYKTLPGYANRVKVDWGNWHSGSAVLYVGGDTVKTLTAYEGSNIYIGEYVIGETIKFQEIGIFWAGEIWVYEVESNIANTPVETTAAKVNYIFDNLSPGENTYQATVIYNDATSETTAEQTITADGSRYLVFDGENDYFKLPTISSGRTVCMRTNISSDNLTSDWNYILDLRTGYANSWFTSITKGSAITSLLINGVSQTVAWASVPQDEWIYMCLGTAAAFTDDGNILSSNGGGGNSEAYLAEVAIFNKILTTTEATELYNGTSTPADITGLRAWYKIDEASGSTLTDSSGNGYTATVYNGPTWSGGNIYSE